MICKKLEVSSFFLHGLVYTYTVIKLGRVQCKRVVSNFGDRTRKIHTCKQARDLEDMESSCSIYKFHEPSKSSR